MAKKSDAPIPTDEEILAMDNVRPDIAGRYIGWSSPTVSNALRQERAPFGFAAQNPETGSWHYNISPGLLVAYKRGTLPTYRLKEVVKLAAEGVDRIISVRLSGMKKITEALGKAVGV